MFYPSEGCDKGILVLWSEMSGLHYLTEPTHNSAKDNVNARAFDLATTMIGGRDVVEEYRACGI
jgi:hypothetical protein